MLLKAVETGYVDQACHLVSKGADLKRKNKDGFTTLDFIFARKIEKLKKAVFGKFGEEEFKLINTEYSEERLKDLSNLLSGTSDVDNVSGNKFGDRELLIEKKEAEEEKQLSGDDNTYICSDVIKSIDSSKGDFLDNKLIEKITKERQRKENDLANLEKQINQLKNKIKTVTNRLKKQQVKRRKLNKLKRKKHGRCSVVSNRDIDFTKIELMSTMCSIITKEILVYINLINDFQKKNLAFYEQTYQRLSGFISANFGKDIKIIKGGSFNYGLIMPWSNLNINVIHKNRYYQEPKKKQSNTKELHSFFKILKADKKLVKSISLEETTSLSVIKLELSSKFNFLTVEIIFKNSSKRTYPENETIIKEYLQAYPISKLLYVIFRTYLHKQELDDPGNGGLNSISVFLFIVGYLQKLEFQFVTNSNGDEAKGLTEFETFINNPANNGQIFINFLFFYSYSFDFYRDCIHPYPINSERRLSIDKKNPKNQVFALTILNPYNEEIILTKSFKRTIDLKEAFKLCYISIFSLCNCSNDKVMKIKSMVSLERSKSHGHNTKIKGKIENNPIKVGLFYKTKKINPKTSLNIQGNEIEGLFEFMNSRNSFNLISKEETEELVTLQDENKESMQIDLVKSNIRKKPCFVINRFFNFNYDSILTYD